MNLKNKTILFLGSSVTYGSASDGYSFVDIIEENCGATCIKEAVSGTTLADINEKSYVSRLKKIDINTKLDLFVCQLSTNDASKKIEIAEVRKAISFIINYVENVFACPIVFYTNTYFNSDEYRKMIKLLYDMKEEFDFHILDLYNDEDMFSVDKELYKIYMKDKIHPTLKGYTEWWSPKIISFLTDIL